jgi:hypothetical protein
MGRTIIVALLCIATGATKGNAQHTWTEILAQAESSGPADLDRRYVEWDRRQPKCELLSTPIIGDSVALASPSAGAASLYVVAGSVAGPESPYVPTAPPLSDTLMFALVDQRCAPLYKSPSWLLLERDGRQLLYVTDTPEFPYLLVRGDDGRLVGLEWDAERGQVQEVGSRERREREVRQARIREMRGLGWSQRAIAAVLEGEVYIGMNAAMVRASWGRPNYINETLTADGRRQQWVYGPGTYVYFENGRVTTIQTSR